MISTLPRVLHIHFWADIRNSAGSVEKVITAFARHGQGYQHLIACCPADDDVRQPFQHHGVAIYPFHENRLLNRIGNKMLGLNAFTYPALLHLIRRLRPEVLHFHNRQELVDKVVSRLDYRPRIVVHYHRHFAKPVIPKRADRLAFISQATARDILSKCANRVPYSIVSNPLSLEVCERMAAVPVGRVVKSERPTILFGGGGNPIKGGAELIAAFARLAPGRARLILAGRNVERLAGLPCPGIEVLGEVPAERFFNLMQQADIVTMPSYDEPFGLIAQEAMALGKLLVASCSGGLTEFTDADNAVIVRPRCVDSLQAGLEEALSLCDKPSRLIPLLARARKRVEAFLPARTATALEACYDAAF